MVTHHMNAHQKRQSATIIRLTTILAVLTALGAGQAKTVTLTVSDGPSLVSALTTINNNPNTSYTLNITQNIKLTGSAPTTCRQSTATARSRTPER
jgi:hypothetical protein